MLTICIYILFIAKEDFLELSEANLRNLLVRCGVNENAASALNKDELVEYSMLVFLSFSPFMILGICLDVRIAEHLGGKETAKWSCGASRHASCHTGVSNQ